MDRMSSIVGDRMPGSFMVGRWRVDATADEIEADGRIVKLEPQQMRLLLVLAEHAGQVVTTQALLDTVWRDLIVTPNSVYQAVAQLRRQLGDSADEPSYIRTVHRKGYRLVAPVRLVDEEPVDRALGSAPMPPPRESPHQAVVLPAQAPQGDRRRRRMLVAATAASTVLVAAGAWRLVVQRGRATALPRVAVLPFVDRSAGTTEQALSRGLSFDVHRELGRRDDVQVVAFDSVLELERHGSMPPSETARRLDVRYLLTGELWRSGAAVRGVVRLIEPPSLEPLWQQSFEQSIETLSVLPASIAREAASRLGLGTVTTGTARGPTEAYELYVLGEDALRMRTPESIARARNYFQRGIDLDAAYYRNYTGLAWAWIVAGYAGAGVDLARAMARVAPLVDKALRLEPQAPEALAAQAELHRHASEWETARGLLQRAIAVYPNYAQAHFSLGRVELDAGWPIRAITSFERTAQLRPLSASPPAALSQAWTFAGRKDAADQAARRAIELEPARSDGLRFLAMSAYAGGELAPAIEAYRRALGQQPRQPYLWHELAWLYLDLGLPDEAAAAFAQSSDQLSDVSWPAVYAAFAWVATAQRGEPPAALDQAQGRAPEDGSAIELMLIRAMAGLPLEASTLDRALDSIAARSEVLLADPWFVFLGTHRLLDLAAVLVALDRAPAAAVHMATVEQQLDALERQGNRWHALDFHRARLLALQGRDQPALDALARALGAGSRRGWWLRLDPAFSRLLPQPRLQVLLAQLEERNALDRKQLGALKKS